MDRQRTGIRRRSCLGAALFLCLLHRPQPTRAESGGTPTFAAGPRVLTADEQARAPDPAAGVVDAVLLVEETKRVETSPGRGKVWYHLRAKIFSEAGLRLAAVAIPNIDEATKVQDWWGRVLCPARAASRLRQDRLSDRVDPETGERSIEGVLPGAAPGCVVDWGYALSGARFPLFEVVPLQRGWPVDRLTYRWLRTGEGAGGYRLEHAAPGMTVTQDKQGGLLRADHVPPAGAASLALWQPHPPAGSDNALAAWDKVVGTFWNDQAMRLERRVSRFAGRPDRLRTAMQAAGLAEGNDPGERLRAAYAWIEANVKVRPSALSGTPGVAALRVKGRADAVLTARSGTRIQRTLCFLSIARALHVEASLVLATEPRVWSWDRYMFLVEQFSHALVEVRAPGAEAVFVALGGGVPYGRIPEEASGGKGLRVTRDRAEPVEIPRAGRE